MSETHDHAHDHSDEQAEALARRAGHIILDGVTALDVENEDAAEIAFAKLLEIDAIEVLLDEDEGELELDISPLMGGVMMVVRQLVDELARRDASSVEDVLALVRSRIDAE